MATEKREKPYPSFPLRWHPSGYWCKKIKGRVFYFGPRWGSWEAALEQYEREASDLHAGRSPKPQGLTVTELADIWIEAQEAKLNAGELSDRTFRDYFREAARVVKVAGHLVVESMAPTNFGEIRKQIVSGVGVTAAANRTRIARMIFRFAETEDLIPGRVKFGTQFSEPSAKAKKKARAQSRRNHGLRMFQAEEIRRILFTASPSWRAMVYLGINCGYGNTDLSEFTRALIAPEVDYPRPKTGEERRSILWPETLDAIHHVERPAPASPGFGARVFLTKTGQPWVRAQGYVNDEIAKQFAKLLDSLGLKRPGLNFYALRHTFSTIAEECADPPAHRLLMGHSDNSMAASYRERIDDSRLRRITDHVRKWLAQ